MATTEELKSLTTIFLDQPPSCLEFCPTAPDYFVVGTYLLTEIGQGISDHQQTKTGTLKLFRLDTISFKLENIQSVELANAVFDLHFSPSNGELFGVVTSAGTFQTYSIKSPNSSPVITHNSTIPVHDNPGVPALYFDWAPLSLTVQRDPQTTGFAVSFSDGTVSIFHTNPPDYSIHEDSMSKTSFSGSMMEIWDVKLTTTGEAGSVTPLLFFGDDFSTLRAFEFDADGEWIDGEFPAKTREFSDRGKFHEAGVTAVLPLNYDPRGGATTLLTGSYDEYVRIYRYQGHGSVSTEKKLGGGVWRLKVLKSDHTSSTEDRCYIILASCMHAGARVLRVSCARSEEGEAWNIEVLAEFSEHQSMNYASDMWRGGKDEADMVFVSSSFYDKRLCVWKFNPSK